MLGQKHFNFAFIGAGSPGFMLKFVSDIIHEPDFIQSGELRLVDVNPQVLDKVHLAVSKMLASTGRNFKVTKHLDFKEALPGVDFVYFTFVTGGFQAWQGDLDICKKHGVLQSVGDTIGPGGIMRALKNVPVVYEVTKEMERVAPNAWAINYTNPEGALCLAIEKYTKIRTFGLCHGTPDTVRELAEKLYKVPEAKLKYRAAGINHLTWITQLEIDGVDVYPQLRGLLAESGHEPISTQLYDRFGLYPCPGDKHVGEFWPYYLRENVLKEQNYRWGQLDLEEHYRVNRVFPLSQQDKLIAGEITYENIPTSSETSTHFMRALSTETPALEMANVINRGYIENVSDGIIVEVPVFIDHFGLHPQNIGKLPAGIAAKCDALGREYSLIVESAIACDRQIALQAMMLDPLTANCDYPEALLDELLASYRGVLSEKWFN